MLFRSPSIVLESCLARIPGGRSRLDSAVAVRAPVGCPKCRNTGYRGRICVSELLVVTDPVRAAIVAGGRESAVEAAAAEAGMTSMLDDGLSKVLEGVTTIDEVLKVTRAE